MFDPLSITAAVGIASQAFKATEMLISRGAEIEQCGSHIARWFNAVQDITAAERDCKKPAIYQRLLQSNSIEATALEVTLAKQKIKEQEKILREMIVYRFGQDVYSDMMKLRKEMYATRQKNIESKKRFWNNVVDILLVALMIGLTGWILFTIFNLLGAFDTFKTGGNPSYIDYDWMKK